MVLRIFYLVLLIFVASSSTSIEKEKDDTDKNVVVQNGHIAMNDSEIILLINSTFAIIEDFDRNSTDYEEALNSTEPEVTLSSSTTTTTTSRPRFHKLKPPSVNSNCKKFSQEEKYSLLENVGARNQLYMADTVEEASKGFVSAYPEETKSQSFADAIQAEVDTDYCDPRCEQIKRVLNEAVIHRDSSARSFSPLNDDDKGDVEVDEGLSTSCYLESFVPIGNCTIPGQDETSWTHEKLCSECHGIYLLNKSCFPSFFNTVRCNNKEMGCIFDTFSHKAHGECQSQSLGFKVLRNRGDNSCEDWIVEQIELPVACQCMLSKNSWLRSKPPGEL